MRITPRRAQRYARAVPIQETTPAPQDQPLEVPTNPTEPTTTDAESGDVAPVLPPPVTSGTAIVVEPDSAAKLEFPPRAADLDPGAPTESVEEKFEDGRVKIRREVTLDVKGNYVNHGKWTMFDREGNEVATGRFNNNRRDGEWMRKYEFGSVTLLNNPPYSTFESPFTSTATFKNGKLDGAWQIKDAEGRVCSEWNYKAGLLDGDAVWNFTSGTPFRKTTYKNGSLNGAYKEWSEQDDVIADDTYKDGRRLASKQKAYDNGAIMWEGMFLHETIEMVKAEDWWSCRPATFKSSGKPVRHGKLTSWFRTGQKQSEGTFKDNLRDGEFTWWHKNTQKAVQGTFSADKPHGEWNWWHENGQKSIHGRYEMGRAVGEWLYWKPNGVLEKRSNQETPDGGSITQEQETESKTSDADRKRLDRMTLRPVRKSRN